MGFVMVLHGSGSATQFMTQFMVRQCLVFEILKGGKIIAAPLYLIYAFYILICVNIFLFMDIFIFMHIYSYTSKLGGPS